MSAEKKNTSIALPLLGGIFFFGLVWWETFYNIDLSPSELSCIEFSEYVNGEILTNAFGGQFEIIKAKNSNEISRSNDKLVCEADLFLSDGTDARYLLELFIDDGDTMWKISPK